MPDSSLNTRSILKNDPAFDGLDFSAMRAEGINYLAELSGKIWTDHNVHDPGITILELLCYALVDLGYRTRMPAIDIFSRNSNELSPDDNFYTPAEILTCNPVTIMDFRKLLIDIREVKNAWLEVNEEWLECESNNIQPNTVFATTTNSGSTPVECKTFLNGLYKVYIELYKGPYVLEGQWTNTEREYIEKIVEKVRSTLLSHRNLCEDFISITVLCKEKIGVCADIDIDPAADAEKIYVRIVETLKGFFSPDPKYYTLPQLLGKGKPIEEIFAGRPYLPESHGFVDATELEAIQFRKEIHVSDVYNALFGIEGIRTIKKLRLRQCGNNPNENISPGECDWKYYLTQNHTSEFSLACSGFRFTRNELPVSVNEKKYKALFDLNYSLSGKILQQFDSLDLPVPKGIYHADLNSFYSIQNELPRVYGTSEGGIPDTASTMRKAQALQLKGYLLFFDQLLANYLAQLSQLRKIFAFKKSNKTQTTYFTGLPQEVPDIDKLLRFGIEDGSGSIMGNAGIIHAMPVAKSVIDDLITQGSLKDTDILTDFDKIEFVTATDRDAAVYILMEDLRNRNFSIFTVVNNVDNWFFYINTTSSSVVLLSKKYYTTEKEAKLAATNVSYIGIFRENYHVYTKSNSSSSSFYLELNMAGYAVYLQQMTEDKLLYVERREAFLEHLLARFSESFTDFAMLSFEVVKEQELKGKNLIKKSNFLAIYDTLGRDRGKSYDYYTNGWNAKNISGFEKRVQAFAGIEDRCGQSLCHFEVMEYTGQYYWKITAAGKNLFKSNSLFNSSEGAVGDLEDFLKAMKEEKAYKPGEIPMQDVHSLSVHYKDDKISYPIFQPSEEKARIIGEQFRQVITGEPGLQDIFVSNEIYRPQLFNYTGEAVRTTSQKFETSKQAISAFKQLIKKINEEDWESTGGGDLPKEKFDLKVNKADPFKLVDVTNFTNKVTPCPDEYRWYLHNEAGDLVLKSEKTYSSPQEGLESLVNELTLYEIDMQDFHLYELGGNHFDLYNKDGSILAVSPTFLDETTTRQAIQFILEFCRKERVDLQYTYLIDKACHWEVQFGNDLVFQSVSILADPENAINTWRKDKRAFTILDNYLWDWDENGHQRLSIKDDRNKIIARLLPHPVRQHRSEDIFYFVQTSFSEKSFKADSTKVRAGYGFRFIKNEQVLLSGYEVYNSRGAAYYNMLRALEKAGHESMYLKSGDEGNREFTFLLKNDESQFIAEHPYIYDTELERDDLMQKTIEFMQGLHAPSIAKKEPVRYTYNIYNEQKLLLLSLLKFATIKEATENACQTLLLAGDAGNFRFPKSPTSGEYQVMLLGIDQWVAVAPGTFAIEMVAESERNTIIETIRPHLYLVKVTPFPDKWRFNFHIGIEPWRQDFQSTEEYENDDIALQAYKKMAADLAGLKIQTNEGKTILFSKQKPNKSNITAELLHFSDDSPVHDEETTPETALAISQLLQQLARTEDKKVLLKMVKKDALAEQGTWIYRLRRKEDFFAYHIDCTNSQDTQKRIDDVYEAVTHKPDYLLICLGGDNIIKRKDLNTDEYPYHYIIKARNVFYAGSPQKVLVLFISIKGYASQDEAEKAFNAEYLLVMKRASKAVNYGPGKFISLEEPLLMPLDICANKETAVVYVPKETRENYYGNDIAAAIAELTNLAKSYPVRLSGKNRYKFSLYDYKKKISYFISAEYKDSPIDAMKAFLFLLLLIRNKKNYYMYCDPDTGNRFIVIREVLLESNRRFLTSSESWGKDGIEKLIGVSQTEGAFHIYINPGDCCFSFFVACKSKLIHPCTYDTAEARDEAHRKLYKELSNYQLPQLPLITPDVSGDHYNIIYNGQPLAKLVKRRTDNINNNCYAELFELLEWMIQLGTCTKVKVSETKFELKNENGLLLAWLNNPTFTEEEWIAKLIEMAIRFPVFRKDNKFYFRIPYPSSPEDITIVDPCGCDEELPPDSRDCYIAWVGGCFNTCEEAFEALNNLPGKLKVEENYRSVFDCTCGSYRIEFIEEDEIVARNPQCYTTREMVCEAVERAKCLINCEGMHMVEHILLRPRPNCDQCDCLIPNCPDNNCQFIWKDEEEEDPCKPAAIDPCFIPGQDPYSCIATVVMPAWPKRFNKQASRDLVSRILYREAPSHIMLRILWLSPKDFCTFETNYKSWMRWMANKKDYCNGQFDLCTFINLLFKTRLDCWWPDPYCESCENEVVITTPCAELNNQEDRGKMCATTVNDIYCWTTPDCCYEYRNVKLTTEQEASKVKLIRKRTSLLQDQLKSIAASWQEDKNIGQALSYLQGNAADEQSLLRIIKGLSVDINEEFAEKNKIYKEVSNILLNFYLDRSLLDKYDPTKLSDIKRTIQKVSLEKKEGTVLLQKWKEPELQNFIHEKTFQALRGIFKNK